MQTYPTPPKGGGIYVIWLSDKHYYGGRTKSFRVRWKEHLRCLRAGTHWNAKMQAAFDKYGGFRPAVLLRLPEDTCVEAEQEWLDEHFGKKGCVNLSPDAEIGGNVLEWTPEQRERHSEIQKKRVFTETHRRRISEAKMGNSISEEARAKIGRANSRRVVSEETRRRMSEAQRKAWAKRKATGAGKPPQ